ncbi:OTU domain-containing protein [Endozoicomonas euniceicola]|uniref:OTU domain-containing protein n=1 Tax=Endozoicomonas euniceicola TaxID=1234143 RepID=A0ABY6GSL3_9GAMM|nr:hypothetical protein [Endozoicomonas euniceicola]UYM15542.1 hypothetical protein NX720_22275 [Endozoicomonas euniceicola]
MEISGPYSQSGQNSPNLVELDDDRTALLEDSTQRQPDSICERIGHFLRTTVPDTFQPSTTHLRSRQMSILEDQKVVTHTVESERLNQVTPSALEFFKNFSNQYWSESTTANFEEQVRLITDLKETFPNYFKKIPLQSLTFKDREQCGAILEGIVNHYQLDLLVEQAAGMNEGWQTTPTIDNGNCLYDAIWQGLGKDKQQELQKKTGKADYRALKEILQQQAPNYRDTIMANSQGIDAHYESIEDYQQQLNDPEKLWGRHATEGKILAQELGINLVLKGGFSYEPSIESGTFVERDDENIYCSEQNTQVVFIGNRKQHYTAISQV